MGIERCEREDFLQGIDTQNEDKTKTTALAKDAIFI